MSAAQIDPFNSWPITWNRDLPENFQFLVTSFGPATFGYSRNNDGFDIFQTQAQLALKDPAAFHSLMIMSTIKKGQLSGETVPGMNVMWHRVEALRMIKERIDGGDIDQCTSEGSIYAVMVLMGIGNMWNAVDQDEFDRSALNRLILHKGGLSIINQEHPVLETSLFGMAVMNPDMLRSDLYAVNASSALDRPQDTKSLLYALLGFLRNISGSEKKIPVTLSRLQSMFSPGTSAHALLTTTTDHPGILNHRQQVIQQRLRTHIVLYSFSVLLWASPYQIEQFINHLQYITGYETIWRRSLRMLAWALVADIPKGSLMFPTQAWQSYEMLCAVQCLSDVLQLQVLEYCLDLLINTRNNTSQSGNELMTKIRLVMFRPHIANIRPD